MKSSQAEKVSKSSRSSTPAAKASSDSFAIAAEEQDVIRGFRIKIYPTQEQLLYLASAQRELMEMWNILVTTWQTHADHCLRYCEENAVVGPVPPRPASSPKTNVPEEIAEWEAYTRLCRDRRRQAVLHCRTVEGLTRKDWANRAADYHGVRLTEKARTSTQLDYRVLRSAVPGITTSHMAQAVIESYRAGLRPKKPPPVIKQRAREMPLRLRSGKDLIKFVGEPRVRVTASGKERVTGSHRCEVSFGPLKLKGRFHRLPPGPFLEGVSIKLAPDGWYAAAKVHCNPRVPPKATKDVIAINAGLQCLYADSEGRTIENPRGNAYSLRVRELAEWIDEAPTHWHELYRRNQLARYQQRMARQVENLIYSEVLPHLTRYKTILVAETTKAVAHGPQTRISRNEEGGYVSAMGLMIQLITQRYGEYDPEANPSGRVRVLPAAGISQRCSCCGTTHASRYQRNASIRPDSKTDCQEPSCRRKIHVDVNAARNLLANFLESATAA